MAKTTKAKDLIERAKAKNRRAKVSFTLDAGLFKRFQEACDKADVAQSRILEELITDFLNSVQ